MSYPAKVAALGATAYYRLGEASGTTINDEIGTADGTYVNTPDLAQAGAIRDGNTAVNFKSASAERGTLTTLGTFGSSMGTCSIAFWVKTTTTSATALLGAFNAGTATAIQFIGNTDSLGNVVVGKTRFLIRNEAGTATRCNISTNIYDGNWHFIVAVTDATVGWVIYVDGYPVGISGGTGTASGTYANLAVAMDIAARNNNGTHGLQFDGALDEVAFFPTRLTADDVINLYFEGAIRSTFSPTASGTYYSAVQALTPALYWRLDETATSYYAEDSSANNRDGFYLGPDISAGQTGYVDSDKAVRFTDETGTGVVRALNYEPFQPNAQLTVVGVSKWDDVINPPAGFQNFFSGDSQDNKAPVLEGGLTGSPATTPDSIVRWYGNVAQQTGKYVDYYGNAVPPQGSPARFHWAFVYDDTTLSGILYVNGNVVAAHAGVLGAPSVGFSGTGGRFQVANRSGAIVASTENWQGQHDEIAVWERLLTQNEIRGLTAAADIAFFDSRTATVSLTPTRSEGFYGAVDGPRSVTAAVTPTGAAEHLTVADSRTITIPLTLNAAESWSHFPDVAFDDAGSVTVSLTPAGTGSETVVASGSVTAPIAPSSTESWGFADERTVTVVLTLTGVGIYTQTGAQSVSVALTPAATESWGFVDAMTATVPVTLAGSGIGFDDSGFVLVAITALGTAYVDSGTLTVPITPSGSQPLIVAELTDLFGSQNGHLERSESGHMEVATVGRTS